ncbi:hypothetical protein [Thiolapillus sp.]
MIPDSYRLASEKGGNIATILHGAYGDYFEQLLCIVDLARKHPEKSFHVFFANHYRMDEFTKLDLDFAKTVAYVDKIEDTPVDIFYQFQVFDEELNEEVLTRLSPDTLAKIDRKNNLLPHVYMKHMQPESIHHSVLPWSEKGLKSFQTILSTLPADIFSGKTIGFMWRYRSAGGAVKPLLMPSEKTLINKYSQVLRQAIDDWNCHVIVAGMKVKTTEENKFYVDAKFPEYGLNFTHENLHYLPGKGWLAEVELISQCDIVLCNPSGFSEAIFLKGKNCIVVDPPLHYVLKTIKNGFPLFNIGYRTTEQTSLLLRCIPGMQGTDYLRKKIHSCFSSELPESTSAS